MIPATVLGVLTLLGLALVGWQFVAAMRFPLRQRTANPSYAPDITILKPLKGVDAETRSCLKSWMEQSYRGRIQLLFGVHSLDDPACPIVRELIAAYPGVEAELVICPESLGTNAKVSTLIQLLRRARHPVITVSDADVHAPGDFLAQALPSLKSGNVGLVNALYRLVNPASPGFAMRCEGFSVNSDFWSQVLQAQSIKPLDFALGATMITTRDWIARIGGFESLADYLADDYHLGNRIVRQNGRIMLATVPVECRSARMSAFDVWKHQLRWARTIRVSQPVPYFFSLLNDATLWASLWAITGLGHSLIVMLAVSAIVVRLILGLLVEAKMTRRLSASSIPAALAYDLVRPAIWALSFLGNTIHWRGKTFKVQPSGKLSPL